MYIKYIILGIVQGLTEFFPVSSSGHLVIFQEALKIKGDFILFIITLHLGTLCALIIFFLDDIARFLRNFLRVLFNRKRKGEIWHEQREIKILIYVSVVTVITGLIGFFGKGLFENLFSSPKVVSFMFLVTGIILLSTSKFMRGARGFSNLNMEDAYLVGLAQAFSIIPGISRSGITISTLLFRGINRELAFKFSFLISIPAILGSLLAEINKVSSLPPNQVGYLAVGLLTALLSGLIALHVLFRLIQKAKFSFFGCYCLAISLISWVLFKIL